MVIHIPLPLHRTTHERMGDEQTYPVDASNLHLLHRLFAALQLGLTDGVQLELLRFGDCRLEVDACDSIEGADVSEAGRDLGDAGAALYGQGEGEVVFAVGLVGCGWSCLGG